MNSTLPDFLAAPAASAPGAAPFQAAALAGLLPGVSPDGAAPAMPADFAALMPPPTVTVQAGPTVLPAATSGTPAAPVAVAVAPVVVTVAAPTQRLANRAAVPAVGAASVTPLAAEAGFPALPGEWNRGILTTAEPSRPAGMAAAPSPAAEILELPVLSENTEVPAELREQAVAFAVALLQNLLPGTAVPAVTEAGGESPDLPGTGRTAAPAAFMPSAAIQATPEGTQGPIMLATSDISAAPLPAGSAASAEADSFMLSAGQGRAETAAPSTAMLPAATPASVAGPQVGSAFQTTAGHAGLALEADGSVHLRIELPPAVAAEANQAEAAPSSAATPVEIHAELAQPGQPVVRVEASGFAATESAAAAGIRQENFAAKNRISKNRAAKVGEAAERNFEFAGDKQVNTRSPEAGITVAKTESIMSAAPTEEPRAARKPQDSSVLPVRAEFQVVQTPAERITAPAPGPAGQTFAERAVETVTGLVEAQFAASMQKSGSVHLRLKFGGEDLSVHVAIRDGAVHTDFRTDSAPLRAALEREWQAVAAASPEQLQRYAEPVFAPAPASSASPFGQGDSRQPAQQQAWSEQHPQRAAREQASDFSRRSLVSETFVPEAPAPRVPVLLPTSLRLSALA